MNFQHIYKKHTLLFVSIGILLFKVIFFAFSSLSFGTLPFSEGDFGGNYQYRTETPAMENFQVVSSALPFMFSHFDAQWYIQIAEQGYNHKALLEEPRNIVFYPLYPVLLFTVHAVLQDTALASFLLANLLSIFGLTVFWKLTKNEFGEKEAYWALIFMLCAPMGVFWHASYTEGLFLLLICSSFLYARKGDFRLAGILGALATFTKVQGVLLLPVLAVEYLLQRREKNTTTARHWGWILLIPLALLAFFTFMYIFTGDFFASVEAQKIFGGGRVLGFRPDVLWETLMNLAPGHTYRNSPVDAAFVVAWLLILAVSVRSMRLSYWLWGLLALLVPLSSWSIMSIGRYSLIAFPLIWSILHLTKPWWYLRIPLLLASFVAMTYFSQQFIHHYWVG